MFPSLARNFAKNGYYPTDEDTLDRALQALGTSHDQPVRILDPCAGEGHAILESAHRLGRDRTDAYGIEFDLERARHMQSLVDVGIQSDLMDTVISPRSFGMMFFNPPYGDLVSETGGSKGYAGKGRQRLEKLFYQRCVHLLQYGGIMVMIVPYYVFDDELSSWVSQHFDRVNAFEAAVDTFKQVVVFGVRTKRNALLANDRTKPNRKMLQQIGLGEFKPEPLPEIWCDGLYDVPPPTAVRCAQGSRLWPRTGRTGRRWGRLKSGPAGPCYFLPVLPAPYTHSSLTFFDEFPAAWRQVTRAFFLSVKAYKGLLTSC